MGERVNGIHEVRGSIPLASIARLGPGRVNRIQVSRLGLDYGGSRE